MQGLLTIYPGNHMVLELQSLTEVISGVAQTTATVSVTLKDRSGQAVAGQSWPAAMAHVSGGTYRATLDADLAVTSGTHYVAVVDAVTATGVTGHWDAEVIAQTRRS